MKPALLRSIRAKLVLLVLIAVLPVGGLVVYTGLRVERVETKEAYGNALSLVQNLAIEHERIASSTRQLLMALSKLPEVQSGNRRVCEALFAQLLEQNKIYTNIIGTDAEGVAFASGQRNTPLPLGHRKHFLDAKRTREFSVGEYIIAMTTRKPILSFAYPIVTPKGEFRGVVVGSVDLDSYGEIFAAKQLPEKTAFTVSDHKGIVLFRYPELAARRGKQDWQARIDRMKAGPEEGVFSDKGQGDNDERIVAYKKFRLKPDAPPYLFMRVSISKEHALAGAKRGLLTNLTFLGITFVIALLTALFIGNRVIVGRLRRLVTASEGLSRGDFQVRTRLPERGDEIGSLSRAFDLMADELERKESDRSRAEKALTVQNLFLQNLINAIPNPVFYKDRDGLYQGCNRAFEEFAGLPAGEILGKTVFEIYPPEVAEEYHRRDEALFAEPGVKVYGSEFGHGSAAKRDVMTSKATYTDGEGRVAGIIGVIVDVSDLKEAEAASRESELKFRTLYESAGDAIFIMRDHLFVDCNEKTLSLFGCGKDELLGLSPLTFSASVQPDGNDSIGKGLEKIGAALRGEPQTFEWRHMKRDGTLFDAEVSLSRIRLGGECFIQAIVRDITPRKAAEERLKASLKEKEILLKEIHHRVKNNLQIISSLLHLQSRSEKDENAKTVFLESINRVKTMANIHALLYQSGDFARIDFKRFVDVLVSQLYVSYDSGYERISTRTEVADVFLDINVAIPCGLLINELVSNAMKHAFPGDRKGRVTVAMHGAGDTVFLTVVDDGVGFPEALDFRNTLTLGLQLVTELAEQLDGTIELKERVRGTEFLIIFKSGG